MSEDRDQSSRYGRMWVLLGFCALGAILTSCGASPSTCSAGATQSCVCGGGLPGGQRCADDGSRWLACECSSTGDAGVADASSAIDAGMSGPPEGFVLIPAGTFTMGSPVDELRHDTDGRIDETQHEVTLTHPFYMESTEVTQAQWSSLMGNNPSYSIDSCGRDCPVNNVGWLEALAYANALSAMEGLPECYTLEGCNDLSPGLGLECDAWAVNAPSGDPYSCAGYRLPMEAEWEYAYRAGTTTAFYNGNITDVNCSDRAANEIGWYCGNSGDLLHPVAQKLPNAWGLYDMAGNVQEMCWDGMADYPTMPVQDPTGLLLSGNRIVRGGSYHGQASYLRAAHRGSVDTWPSDTPYTGFRLVRTVAP